ncbi:MAG: DUF169 domain-containing protein [Candidatus Bathyarchaeia archaeon]
MDGAKILQSLERYLRLQTHPFAVRMMKSQDEVPSKVKRPQRDFGHKIAVCQGIAFARKYGWSVAMTADDLICPIALEVFGLAESAAFWLEGNLCVGMYNETLEAGARTEEATYKFKPNEYAGILVAPLFRLDFEPDVVGVYCNPAQAMRLVQAALYKQGGRLEFTVQGRADCSEEIIQTMLKRKPQLILPCNGDRVFGGVADDELAFFTPNNQIDEIVYGLEETHKNGIRYPIPQTLAFEPRFPESYRKLYDIITKAQPG